MQHPLSRLGATSLLVVLALGATAPSHAGASSVDENARRAAAQRYENDKKLCNDEASSRARLQCRRDAKAEYEQALAAARAQAAKTAAAPSSPAARCPDCGQVVSVSVTEKQGEGGAIGIIGGGAAGALLGNQIGGGVGKDLATIAGAVGGAYAGKKIEERVRSHKVWTVQVHYGDGTRRSFEFNQDPGLAAGDAVRNSGDSIVRD